MSEPASASAGDAGAEDDPQVTDLLAYRSNLRRYFSRAIGAQDADDYVQEVLARSIKAAAREKIENPGGFLLRAASNLLIERYRRKATRQRGGETPIQADAIDVAGPGADSPERIVAAREQLQRVAQVLQAMPEARRRAFVLVRFEGRSYREVALAMGISESSVWSHLDRAMVNLIEAGIET